ncbi:MAG: response regulator [Chloroflexi bacterium]|nr:response regulator [Chloroflexota bacterium]
MSRDTAQRIMLVDDDPMFSEMLRLVLAQEGFDVTLVGTGEDAYEKAVRQPPDLAIVDVVLPRMDGFTLCRRLRQAPTTRALPILILTVKGDVADKIAGFEAGADDYLTKPFQPQELTYRIRGLLGRAQSSGAVTLRDDGRGRGQVIAVFGTKGGVGKTMIAVNLAVALKKKSGKAVTLFDADFFFGDVGVHLNLPTTYSIVNLIERTDRLDPSWTDGILLKHESGIRVLLSPFRPEDAELVTVEHVKRILDFLAQTADYVVVDCQSSYDDRMLTILERCNSLMVVITPEIGSLKNTYMFLELAARLGLPMSKVHIVLNRSNSGVGIDVKEVEKALRQPVAVQVVSGGQQVVISVNRGTPLVLKQPDHVFSKQVMQMTELVLAEGQRKTKG